MLSFYYVLGTVLSDLCTLTQFMLVAATPWGKYNYYDSSFADEGTKAEQHCPSHIENKVKAGRWIQEALTTTHLGIDQLTEK